MTLLQWTLCSTLHTVSTQLHHTLHNCCGSPFAALLHTVAVRWQHITPAGQNLSNSTTSPLQSEPTSISEDPPTPPIFTVVGSAFLSNISIEHVQPVDITQPNPCHHTPPTIQFPSLSLRGHAACLPPQHGRPMTPDSTYIQTGKSSHNAAPT